MAGETTIVFEEDCAADSFVTGPVAVTVQAIVLPTSAVWVTYELDVALPMFAPLRVHW